MDVNIDQSTQTAHNLAAVYVVKGRLVRNHYLNGSYNHTGKVFPTTNGKLNNLGIMEEAPHWHKI